MLGKLLSSLCLSAHKDLARSVNLWKVIGCLFKCGKKAPKFHQAHMMSSGVLPDLRPAFDRADCYVEQIIDLWLVDISGAKFNFPKFLFVFYAVKISIS